MTALTWSLAPPVYVPTLCWQVLRDTDKFCTREKHTTGLHEHEYTGTTWTQKDSVPPSKAAQRH